MINMFWGEKAFNTDWKVKLDNIVYRFHLDV